MTTPQFAFNVTAINSALAPLRAVSDELRHLRDTARSVSKSTEEVGRSTAFQQLGTHVSVLTGRFHTLNERIRGALGSLAAFAPALGALGATGSLVGLVGLTRGVAQGRVASINAEQVAGMAPGTLGKYKGAAAMLGMDPDVLVASIGKLNKTLAEARANGDKIGFKSIGIDVKSITDASEAMPQLIDYISKIKNPLNKATAERLLFGKSGAELAPMMNSGPGGVAAAMQQTAGLSHQFTPEETENLKRNAQAWTRLDMAMSGLKNSIGAQLAPVITPLVNSLTNLIAANREVIASFVTARVKEFADALKKFDFHHPTASLKEMFTTMAGGSGTMKAVAAGIGGISLIAAAPIIGPIGKLAVGIFEVGKSFVGMATLIAANPVLALIGAAIALIGFAAYEIYTHWSDITAKFHQIMEWLQGKLKDFKAWLRDLTSHIAYELTREIKAAWADVEAFFTTLWNNIINIFQKAWDRIKPIVDDVKALGRSLGLIDSGTGTGGASPPLPGPHRGLALHGIGPRSADWPSLRSALENPVPRVTETKVTVLFDNLPRGTEIRIDKPAGAPTPAVEIGRTGAFQWLP